MSPDVDIAIGDEPEVTYEEEGIVRGNVDDRLKKIQEEDNKSRHRRNNYRHISGRKSCNT